MAAPLVAHHQTPQGRGEKRRQERASDRAVGCPVMRRIARPEGSL